MLLQICFALATLGWAAVPWLRGERAVAVASASMALVCATAGAAAATDFDPWLEGGYGMHVLALVGGYSIGAAAGARVSGRAKPRFAALVGVTLLAVSSTYLFQEARSGIAEVVRNVPPADAELIITATRGEALRLVQYGSVLGAIATALLVWPRRRATQRLSPSPLRAAA